MSDRRERFRRLQARSRGSKRPGDGSAAAAGAQESSATGDLFEHFGVAVEPPSPREDPVVAVEAAACRRCGWLLAYRRDETACPACGEPEPLSASET